MRKGRGQRQGWVKKRWWNKGDTCGRERKGRDRTEGLDCSNGGNEGKYFTMEGRTSFKLLFRQEGAIMISRSEKQN